MSFFPHYAELVEPYHPETTTFQEMPCEMNELVLVVNEHPTNGWSYCEKVTTKNGHVEKGFVPTTFMKYVKVKKSSSSNSNELEVTGDHKYEQYYRQLSFGCESCGTRIKARDEKMICLDCGTFENQFIVCMRCYESKDEQHWSQEAKKRMEFPLVGEPLFMKTRRHAAENLWLITGRCAAESLSRAFLCFKERPCLGYRKPIVSENNKVVLEPRYSWLTYDEVYEKALSIGTGLEMLVQKINDMNPSRGKKRGFIGICSINRVEWFTTDVGCLLKGMVTVGLPKSKFDTEDLVDMAHIINNGELDVIVCESKYTMQCISMANKARKADSCFCPTVKVVIQMEDLTTSQQDNEKFALARECQIQLFSLSDVERIGARNENRLTINTDIQPNDLATIVYTSGSTGRSKGAIITDSNLNNQLVRGMYSFHPLVNLSFSPLSHMSDRLNVLNGMINGGRTGMFSGDMSQIFDDFRALQPTILSSTPRLYNSLYSEYQKMNVLLKTSEKSINEVDLMKQFSGILGGRMQAMTSGGAATSQEVIDFLRKCFKCRVYNGYASTELGAISWIDVGEDKGAELKFEGVDIKLVDVPELGYYSTDKPYPRGEIVVKSPTAIPGYYRDEEKTSELIDKDGFYHTGDIGVIGENNKLTIIDRLKNIFKLSQGEFVAPEPLENFYLSSEFINQIFISGDSMKTFLVAVIVPNVEVIEKAAKENNLQGTIQDLCQEGTLIYRMIMQDIVAIGKRAKVASYEIPKGFIFELEKFTVDNGKLTGPEKPCRPFLSKVYKQQLDKLYNDLEKKTHESDLLATITNVLGIGHTIDSDASFAEVGGDSISAAKLSVLIEQQLDIKISAKDLLQNVPLSEVLEMIKSGGKNCFTSAKTISLEEEITLDDSIFTPDNLLNTMKSPDAIRHVLLTGATGFLGGALLHELLNCSQDLKVHCIVRANNDKEAYDRIIRNLETMDVAPLSAKMRENIVAYCGDLNEAKLGLSDNTWSNLCDTIDAVYHNGAHVNFVLSYWELKKSNVLSVVELLKLCTTGSHLKPLHFVSSIGVLGSVPFYHNVTEDMDLRSIVPESAFQQLQGYSQSKYIAEGILTIARNERRVPISIFRPTLICGHSQTGHSNITEWISRYICGVVQLKVAPESNALVHMVPVDFVAQAIVSITTTSADKLFTALTKHKSYHLINTNSIGSSVSVNQMTQHMKSYGYEIEQLPYGAWVSFVKQTAVTNPENSVLPIVSMFDYSDFPESREVTSCHNLLEGLNGSDVSCSRIDSEALFHKFLRSFKKQQVL